MIFTMTDEEFFLLLLERSLCPPHRELHKAGGFLLLYLQFHEGKNYSHKERKNIDQKTEELFLRNALPPH